MGWYGEAFQKSPIVTGGLTVASAFGLYWVGKRLFTGPALPKANLPTGGKGIPMVGTGPGGAPIPWSPVPLASNLFDVMDGIDLTYKKEDQWRKLAELPTDDMVVATYNYFNSMPAVVKAQAGTLVQWIRDEYGAVSGSTKPEALARLTRLGLA